MPISRLLCTTIVLLALACGDDNRDGGDGASSAGDAGTTAASGSEGATAGAEAGSSTNGETGGPAETGETGQALGCPDFETEAECEAAPECMAVMGQPLKTNGGGNIPCLEPTEFLGCILAGDCDQAETWFCQGNNGKAYLVPNGCGPDNTEPCDPIPESNGPCQ